MWWVVENGPDYRCNYLGMEYMINLPFRIRNCTPFSNTTKKYNKNS